MKFLHISDLHLGKRVNEFSMIEDQRYILDQIIEICETERPDGVLIAGDVYDKPVPPVEAVQLLDRFLTALSEKGTQTFVISGNHDSAERIAFASALMERAGIHISPAYTGEVEPFTLEDEFGQVNIYLLPYIKPARVRAIFQDTEILSYSDAVQAAISHMEINSAVRNVIVSHQFVTGAQRSESEEIFIGGSENVNASVFDQFDYAALGHIHRPQNISRKTIRYSGSPLKYSFSESNDIKSVTVVELAEKGHVAIRAVPLVPLHDMREIRGTYEDITSKKNYEGAPREDYIRITLTDEEDILDAAEKLRVIYPNLMKLDYDNTRTRTVLDVVLPDFTKTESPSDLFHSLYLRQNGEDISMAQSAFLDKMIASIWTEI